MSALSACAGSCDGFGGVTVDEIITMVNVTLGGLPTAICSAGDADASGDITIDEILTAVGNALSGCVRD